MSVVRAEVGGARPVLEVSGVTVEFPTPRGPLRAVDDVTLSVLPGEIVGIVGESGSGKSMLLMSLMNLVPAPGRIAAGSIMLGGVDVRTSDRKALERLRGSRLGLIPPDPSAALNPLARIGHQAAEGLRVHRPELSREQRRAIIVRELERCGMGVSPDRLSRYPHQFSGGMQQRVAIAMATQLSPSLLLADEPTTALDVTVQAQVLALLRSIRDESGTSVLFVSHDISVVASLCDRIVVMYAGQIVEEGPTAEVCANPVHPYARALLQSIPPLGGTPLTELTAIPGWLPDAPPWPQGCRFAERCWRRAELGNPNICTDSDPTKTVHGLNRRVSCHFPLPSSGDER